MSFARLRSIGLWTFDSVVEDFELEAIDENLSNALDGADGGAYVMNADMVIGGSNEAVNWEFNLPVIFDAFAEFNDDAIFDATAFFNSDAQFNDDATFFANADFRGNVEIGNASGDDLTVNATTEFEADVYLNGTAFLVQSQAVFFDTATFHDEATYQADVLFEGGVEIDQDLEVDGDVYFNGTAMLVQSQAVFFDTVTVRDVMSFASSGKVKYRQQIAASDGDQTIVAAQVDTFFIPNGVFTTNHYIDIDDTGAQDGLRVKIWSEDDTNLHHGVIRKPGATGIGYVGGTSSKVVWVERVGGIWKCADPDKSVEP